MNNPIPLTPNILLETKHWLAVNKPADMAVEGAKGGSPTIQSILYNYLQQKEKKPYVGIVHRLDRVTTGVLLIAKKKSTLKLLNQQFRERTIQKTYLAISDTMPAEKTGVLQHYLRQDAVNRKAILLTHPAPKAIACKLKYEHIDSSDMGYHLFEIDLITGKYHQIRAQLASIDCPIVGDEKYGSKAAYYRRAIALHAWRLTFTDPVTQKVISLKATPPNDPFWNDFKVVFKAY